MNFTLTRTVFYFLFVKKNLKNDFNNQNLSILQLEQAPVTGVAVSMFYSWLLKNVIDEKNIWVRQFGILRISLSIPYFHCFWSAWAYRPDDVKDVKGISKIPAQPIAASDAEKLLR